MHYYYKFFFSFGVVQKQSSKLFATSSNQWKKTPELCKRIAAQFTT